MYVFDPKEFYDSFSILKYKKILCMIVYYRRFIKN